MAKDTAANAPTDDSTEWDRIPTGSIDGTEWDFDKNGPLIGHFLGSTTVETQKVETGEATAYTFDPVATPGEIAFVWASAQLTTAFSSDLIRLGDKVRITYMGKESFTGAKGPQQIRRYKVEAAKR